MDELRRDGGAKHLSTHPFSHRIPMSSELSAEELRSGMQLVRAIARRVARRFGPVADVDDLVQAGMVGLLEAARRYDTHRSIPFVVYAGLRVRGAMLDSMIRASGLSRRDLLRARATAVDSGLPDRSPFVCTPSLDDLDRAELRGAGFGDATGEGVDGSIRCQVVWDAVARLPALQRDAVRWRFYEEGSLSEYAMRHGRSRSWATRVLRLGMEALRDSLSEWVEGAVQPPIAVAVHHAVQPSLPRTLRSTHRGGTPRLARVRGRSDRGGTQLPPRVMDDGRPSARTTGVGDATGSQTFRAREAARPV
jgi:RNA polymerase sigma factor (sigma-70 family)